MFKCKKCGSCCRSIGENEMYRQLDRGDGCCRYIDLETNKCSIYEQRPLICRVDEAYQQIFSKYLSLDEYYKFNYDACKILKEKMEGKIVTDIKSALREKFEEIFGYTPGDDYVPRVNNAKEIICQGKYNKDDMIDITDTSISSNGKSGLVLTIDSVCVKDAANSTSKFIAKYEDIDYTYMNEEKFLGMDISALELNMKFGTKYKISIDAINKYKLMDFIDYAVFLYQENDKLEW